MFHPKDEYSVELCCSKSDKEIETIKSRMKVIAVYNSFENCLLILNRFATKKNYNVLKPKDINKDMISQDCYVGLYPIPNFWTSKYYTDKNECHLPDDFIIYVLETKSGKYLDDAKLTGGRFMPVEWKNGFSKGIAISDEKGVVIYWLIVW